MKLKKEVFLIIGISIFIIVLEILTNIITEKSVEKIELKMKDINYNLSEILKIKENDSKHLSLKKDIENKIEDLKKEWLIEQDKLSIFSEHDELEKVTRCLITLQENTKNEEYEIALEDCSEFIYGLNHIKEKDKLEIKNIF